MNSGGFDVVIGNPPYVRATSLEINDKNFFYKKFVSAKEQFDLYYLFYEQSIKLLKEGGKLGFITPIGFLNNSSGVYLRKNILISGKIKFIIDVSKDKVFISASTYPIIFLFDKLKEKDYYFKIGSMEILKELNPVFSEIPLKTVEEDKNKIINIKIKNNFDSILNKCSEKSISLGNFSKIYRGIQINKIKLVQNKEVELIKDEKIYSAIHLKEVKPWVSLKSKYYAVHNNKKAGKDKISLFEQEKLLIPRFVLKLQADYSFPGEYILDNIYIINLIEKKCDLRYLCGLFNAKLFNFFYINKFSQTHIAGGYFAINGKQLKDMPIRIPSSAQEKKIVELVNQMLELQKKYHDEKVIGHEKERLKQQIDNVDYEIDQEVYKLYELTPEEIKIVEESLK